MYLSLIFPNNVVIDVVLSSYTLPYLTFFLA